MKKSTYKAELLFLDVGQINQQNTNSSRLSQPLSIASWKQMSNESYLDFYTRIHSYQMENLLKVSVFLSSLHICTKDLFKTNYCFYFSYSQKVSTLCTMACCNRDKLRNVVNIKAGTRVSGSILDQDDVLTKSHQLLLCVIWLERIDHR